MARIRVIVDVDKPPGTFRDAADPVLQDWATRLARAINGPWPEKTGRSRFVTERLAPGSHAVQSPAKYAQFVRLKGERIPFVDAHLPVIVARSEADLATRLAPLMGEYATPIEEDNG